LGGLGTGVILTQPSPNQGGGKCLPGEGKSEQPGTPKGGSVRGGTESYGKTLGPR